MLLVFVSQVIASSAISCGMMNMENSHVSDHSDHMMAEHHSDTETTPADNCCDKSGGCSMSGCITFALATPAESGELGLFTENVVSQAPAMHYRISSSLYRPPILS